MVNYLHYSTVKADRHHLSPVQLIAPPLTVRYLPVRHPERNRPGTQGIIITFMH